MTRESLIEEMKSFAGSSFMSIAELTRWSGRSREYISSLIYSLEWISADGGKGKSFFIPDVADAIMERQEPREGRGFRWIIRDVDRSTYRDDMIGERARGKKVQMYYDAEFKRDAVALADKIGANNVSKLMGVNLGTLGGWRYARTCEESSGEEGFYAGIGSESSEELFERLTETYGLDIDDIKTREKKYVERYGYLYGKRRYGR